MSALTHFAEQLDYALDDFQREACESLVAGRSVLVAAPTGSGKTCVADFAAYLARRERDARIFYTTPIKALSNQKFQELQAQYGAAEVGLLTGDLNIQGDAPIVVMTTEVLRNMLYAAPHKLHDLAFVVLDEVHYLGDKMRGAVWEEIILHLPAAVRVVALSATVSNAEELGDWLHAVRGETDVVLAERRPVPLYQSVFTGDALLPLFVDDAGYLAQSGSLNPQLWGLGRGGRGGHGADGRGAHGADGRGADRRGGRGGRGGRNRRRSGRQDPQRYQRAKSRISRADVALALDETELLPAIMFIFSRAGCDQAVKDCLFAGISLTTQTQRQEIRRLAQPVIAQLHPDDRQALQVNSWLHGLERGVAAHHAGLLPAFKQVVEELFQRRLVQLVFATDTLALGINMPARAVVIERLDKFDGQSRQPLSSGEYTQLTGRAGRRGIDVEGHAIVLWRAGMNVQELSQLAGARSFPVHSSFRPTANMAVNLLLFSDYQQACDTLELSFAQFQVDREVVDEARQLQAQVASLSGYEAAIARSHGSERQRWEDRARKLRRQITRGRRRLANRTGTIARSFERVVKGLLELGYLRWANTAPGAKGGAVLGRSGERLLVTGAGEVLRHIYGEKDLVVAECLRRGVFWPLSTLDLVAVCCALSYEPRREETPQLDGGAKDFRAAFMRISGVWQELNERQRALQLPIIAEPHPGLALVMRSWAAGASFSEVLRASGLGAGDFVRWAKQTVDLLDQLYQAASAAATHPELAEAAGHYLELSTSAKAAKRLVLRGIVAEASGLGGC